MRLKNRRKYIRLEAYHLGKVKLVSDPLLLCKATVNARISNISAGGCCLRTEKFLPIGSKIELQINFPNIPQLVSAVGDVVWTKQIAKTDRYEFGIEFKQISEELRKVIDEHIKYVCNRCDGGFNGFLFGEGGEKEMRLLAKISLGLALICTILAMIVKFTNLGAIMPIVMPVNWIILADTALLFSIALALLAK